MNERSSPVYRSRRWKEVRRLVLERDGHWCRLGLLGCRGVAVSVDHIVELQDGGDPFALANLQAACVSCNTRKGNYRRQARERGFRRW